MIKTNPERKYKPALFHTSTAMWPITGLCLFQNNVYEDSTIRKRVCCMIQQALKHTEDVTYVFGDHMTFSFDWGTVWPRDTKSVTTLVSGWCEYSVVLLWHWLLKARWYSSHQVLFVHQIYGISQSFEIFCAVHPFPTWSDHSRSQNHHGHQRRKFGRQAWT